MTWLYKLRLRVFAIIGAVSLIVVVGFSLPLWAVVGAVVGTLVLTVNTMAAKLDTATCLGCGEDLANEPAGEHGVVCPACGTISLPRVSMPDMPDAHPHDDDPSD